MKHGVLKVFRLHTVVMPSSNVWKILSCCLYDVEGSSDGGEESDVDNSNMDYESGLECLVGGKSLDEVQIS